MQIHLLRLHVQGPRKQSPDGQAQFDVGGEVVNNSRAKRVAKFWTLLFSSEEALSLHFSFTWTGILRPGSLVVLNVSLMRAHLGTYPAELYYSNSRPHKCQTRNYVSTSAENGPAMAGPARPATAGPAGPVPAPMMYSCYMGHSYYWPTSGKYCWH